MSKSYEIVLRAGEECCVAGISKVCITLTSGSLEVEGITLESTQNYEYFMNNVCNILAIYTLEGGIGKIESDGDLTISKYNTKMIKIVRLARRLSTACKSSIVLIIGNNKSGKSYIARTLYNLVQRYKREEVGDNLSYTYYADLNVKNNSLYAPSCMSMTFTKNEFLKFGATNSPELNCYSFYTGSAEDPSSKTLSFFFHFSTQLCESVAEFDKEHNLIAEKFDLIIDCPTPEKELNYESFYRELIKKLNPTHIIITGNRDDDNNKWALHLEEDTKRYEQNMQFFFFNLITEELMMLSNSLVKSNTTSSNNQPSSLLNITAQKEDESNLIARKLQEYFIGKVEYSLLCSKVVLSIKSLQFVSLLNQSTNASAAVLGIITSQEIQVNESWRGLVCALSHAEVVAEVALAPIAGLLIIAQINIADDEIVLILPSSDNELLRRCIIVPVKDSWEHLRLPDHNLAIVEQSTVM